MRIAARESIFRTPPRSTSPSPIIRSSASPTSTGIYSVRATVRIAKSAVTGRRNLYFPI